MNILLINHYAGSILHGMEYRPYYLSREWVRLGAKVRIVASSKSHVRAQEPELGDRRRLLETIDGIQYLWLRTIDYSGNGVQRIGNIGMFLGRLYLEGRNLGNSFRPNVVIASSTYPMDIYPARYIAKMVKARLVYEVHDLWPLTPMELGGLSKWHPFITLTQAAENYAYRHCDVVVSILPRVREYMESRGMAEHKLHIVPNGIDPEEWSHDPPELDFHLRERLKEVKEQNMMVVGYAGTHGLANALDTLLDAAYLMRSEKVTFVLVGGGAEKPALKERARAQRLENVLFFESVKKEQIPALLEWFDVAYLGWLKQPLYRFGISPNKLMDYMMAGRAILHSVEAGNDPVAEAGCGVTVKPEDPEAVARGFRSLFELSESERNAIGKRGKAFVLKNYTYPVLAKRFLAAINEA